MRKRQTSDEERALFEAALKGAEKLEKLPRAKKKPAIAKRAPNRQTGTTHGDGLDGRTATRLRKGQMEPEARLDLHGLTEAAAHRALIAFVSSAYARKLRLVLVVTGKGRPQADDAPFDLELVARGRGVLRSLTPRWLKEPELARLVASVSEAHRKHGGAGALYVYLRKFR